MKKAIKKLAKEIEKEIETNGWSLDAHTKTIALLAMIEAN